MRRSAYRSKHTPKSASRWRSGSPYVAMHASAFEAVVELRNRGRKARRLVTASPSGRAPDCPSIVLNRYGAQLLVSAIEQSQRPTNALLLN